MAGAIGTPIISIAGGKRQWCLLNERTHCKFGKWYGRTPLLARCCVGGAGGSTIQALPTHGRGALERGAEISKPVFMTSRIVSRWSMYMLS